METKTVRIETNGGAKWVMSVIEDGTAEAAEGVVRVIRATDVGEATVVLTLEVGDHLFVDEVIGFVEDALTSDAAVVEGEVDVMRIEVEE